jgi:peptidyl-prolyl cis-trans isomerase C
MMLAIHPMKTLEVTAAENAYASRPRQRRLRAGFVFGIREPFFHFIALGLLIWGGVEYWSAPGGLYTIDIGPTQRERIARSYQQQFGERPTAEQLQRLVNRYIREEIFLREGLGLHLDRGDEIVRRRIVQKYEFLSTDLATPESPHPGVLEHWFQRHQHQYLAPERVAFSQIYFSPDKDGEQGAKDRAQKALEKLTKMKVSRAPKLGDAFPGPADVAALVPEEAARLFGNSDFSRTLFELPLGHWAGPYRSGYGWHLIYVTERQAPMLPALAEIHERVLADYLEEQRRILNERAYESLRRKYTIVQER